MGSKAGVIKIAAARAGLSVEEYIARRAAGLKRCAKCKEWRAESAFDVDHTRGDDHAATCKACRNRRTTVSPGKRERQQKRLEGLAWCRDCEDWLPFGVVLQGRCRTHINQERRVRYANDPDFRHRLKQFVYERKRRVDAVPPVGETFLMKLFEGKCAYCGAPATTMDHINPVVKGGRTTPGNMLPACRSCNSSKGDQDVHDWMQKSSLHPSEMLMERFAWMEASLFG